MINGYNLDLRDPVELGQVIKRRDEAKRRYYQAMRAPREAARAARALERNARLERLVASGLCIGCGVEPMPKRYKRCTACRAARRG